MANANCFIDDCNNGDAEDYRTAYRSVPTRDNETITTVSTVNNRGLLATLFSCSQPSTDDDTVLKIEQQATVQTRESSLFSCHRPSVDESDHTRRSKELRSERERERARGENKRVIDTAEEGEGASIDITTVGRRDAFMQETVSTMNASSSTDDGYYSSYGSQSSYSTKKDPTQAVTRNPKMLKELQDQVRNQILAASHNGSRPQVFLEDMNQAPHVRNRNTTGHDKQQTSELVAYNNDSNATGKYDQSFAHYPPAIYGANSYHGHQFHQGAFGVEMRRWPSSAETRVSGSYRDPYWGGQNPHVPHSLQVIGYGNMLQPQMVIAPSNNQDPSAMRRPLHSIHTPVRRHHQRADNGMLKGSIKGSKDRFETQSVHSGSSGSEKYYSQENRDDISSFGMSQNVPTCVLSDDAVLKHGDVRRVKAGVLFGKYDSEKTDLFETAVPPGKMGVKLGSAKDGVIIRSIRKDSILQHLEYVNCGDIIVGLDGVNISHFPARAVAKLLHSKKYSPNRIIVYKPCPESKMALEARERAAKELHRAQQMARYQEHWTPQQIQLFNAQREYDDYGWQHSKELYKV